MSPFGGARFAPTGRHGREDRRSCRTGAGATAGASRASQIVVAGYPDDADCTGASTLVVMEQFCGQRKPSLMDSQKEQLIDILGRLAKDREERDLIATLVNALDARYDLSRKLAKETGVGEIIKQLLGRILTGFGDLANVSGKRILDLACGSNTSKAPSSIYIDTPFGAQTIGTADTEGYTAQFEPWFCRVLLQLGAHPVGIDLGDLEGEAFEHYRVDLGQIGALDFLPGHSFDAVQDSRLFGSPEFTGQFPDPSNRLKVAIEIRRQEERLLTTDGRVIHSDAEQLAGRQSEGCAESLE